MKVIEYEPPCGSAGMLLPQTVVGSDSVKKVIQKILRERIVEWHSIQKSPFMQFLEANRDDETRRELVREIPKALTPAYFHHYEIAHVARAAVQSKLDSEVLGPLLRWFLISEKTPLHISGFIFSQMMAKIEQAELLDATHGMSSLVNELIKMKPEFYWASDALHRMQVQTLLEFAKNGGNQPDQKAVDDSIAGVKRITRRIVRVMDVRYENLLHKCINGVQRMFMYLDREKNPDLYELSGLLQWAVKEIANCRHQQYDMPLRAFKVFLAEKYGITQDVTMNLTIRRSNPNPNVGPYGHFYAGELILDIQGLAWNSEPEVQWRHVRGRMSLKVEVDCPAIDEVKNNEGRRYLLHRLEQDNYSAGQTFNVWAHSMHTRLRLSAEDTSLTKDEKERWFFRGLMFYLSQTNIPELQSSFNMVTVEENK